MMIKQALCAGTALGLAMLMAGVPIELRAQQAAAVAAPAIDADDIGGIVISRMGPESGVWVVAETTDLGTRFAKMAVTDDFGRYVIPDLPKATYRVWVRGYGLIDSPKVTAEPGKTLNLTAVIAPSLAAAAQYYQRHCQPDDARRRPSGGARRLDRPHQGRGDSKRDAAASGRGRAQPRC